MIQLFKYTLIIKVEPYWNVNSNNVRPTLGWDKIKVEPYWNVNTIEGDIWLSLKKIKVEPYWNVNNLKVQLNDLTLELKQNHIGM